MHFRWSSVALAAGLLALSSALSADDIPSDQPVSALLTLAQTHLSRGETSDALLYYDAAIAKDPSNYLTFFKRATTYLSLGRTGQATDDFQTVLTLRPGFQSAHLQLAKIRAKFADWDAAKAEYVAADKAGSPELLQLEQARKAADLARAAETKGQWEECVNQAGEAIVVAPRAASLRHLRARCRFQRGETEEGVGDLQHLLNMRPGDTAPHVVISASAFYGLADLDAGLAQIRKCLHSDPDSKACKKLHKQEKSIQKAYAKVEAQLAKGQVSSAARALAGSQEDAGLLSKVREQVDELRQAGSLPSKGSAKLYGRLVEMACQASSESNSKDAGKHCAEAMQLNDDSFWGLLYRGKQFLKEEDFEAAIRTLESASKAGPDKGDKVNPLLNKARIELKRSKTKDYYKVLGVASDADERQIKSAYRKASKLYHPDKAAKQGYTKEQAEKKMAAINEAYEVLSNPELRARFDRGDDPNSQEQQGSPFQGSPFGGAGGHPFMFQQGGTGGNTFKFQFGGAGGNPFGF